MSHRESILEYLINTALAQITTGNGYNFTLATKSREALSIDEMADSSFPAVFIPRADERFANIATEKKFQSTMTVVIWGFVRNSSGRVQPELSKLLEDVEKALTTDISQNNLVMNTAIKFCETDEGELPMHAFFRMEVEMKYVATWTTP